MSVPEFVGDLSRVSCLFQTPLLRNVQEIVFEYLYGFRFVSKPKVESQSMLDIKAETCHLRGIIESNVLCSDAMNKVAVLTGAFRRPFLSGETLESHATEFDIDFYPFVNCHFLAFVQFKKAEFVVSDLTHRSCGDSEIQCITFSGEDRGLLWQLSAKFKEALNDMDPLESSKWSSRPWLADTDRCVKLVWNGRRHEWKMPVLDS